MTIYFYVPADEHGYLSNFASHGITLAGRYWPTVEHYFQAQKFVGTPHEDAVQQAPTAKRAAELGRDRARPLRADWEAARDDVMRAAVGAKFAQHDALRAKLLATGDADLVERSPSDYYWGCGADGSGKNMLGRILMEVRAALRASAASAARPLRVVRGDATAPQARGNKVIAHVCNDLGGWGKGFVVAISRRWPAPEADYRAWHGARAHNDFALGAVRVVQVQPDTWVANMIGQHGMRTGSNGPPIRYDALAQCLARLAVEARRLGASVHMPRIGCGLAGGRWELVEPLVRRALCDQGVDVTVYDYE